METIFLFGAGASFGSDDQNTPPLGEGLFDELQRFNASAWGTITGKLAREFRKDFEEAMKSVNPQALAPLQRAMAAYFFEFKPTKSNVYYELAQRISQSDDWSGAICTLNYERLLEICLCSAGVPPFVGKPPPESDDLELCLPHGCCHIFCDGVQASSGISFHGTGIQTGGHLSVITDPQQHRARINQDMFPPVMSYFVPSKHTTSGGSFIDGQRTRWRELAMNATTIVIVGVRVRPHDDHVWSPIAETDARVVYCGGPSGASEYRTWADTTRAGHDDSVLNGFFRDEFSAICVEAGL